MSSPPERQAWPSCHEFSQQAKPTSPWHCVPCVIIRYVSLSPSSSSPLSQTDEGDKSTCLLVLGHFCSVQGPGGTPEWVAG